MLGARLAPLLYNRSLPIRDKSMTSFASQTFARISAQYNALEDFSPAPLFIAIGEMVANEQYEVAQSLLAVASELHSVDPFIVEGETTNNEVFLEVFRRVFFVELPADAEQEDKDAYRSTITHIGVFLSDFAHRVATRMPEAVYRAQGANDGRT